MIYSTLSEESSFLAVGETINAVCVPLIYYLGSCKKEPTSSTGRWISRRKVIVQLVGPQTSSAQTMREDVIHAAPIEEFDFERVAATMKALKWEWGAVGEIPTAKMLRRMVHELMAEWGKPLRRSDGTSYTPREIASGGIGLMEQDGSVLVFFSRTEDHRAAHLDIRKEWAKAKRK